MRIITVAYVGFLFKKYLIINCKCVGYEETRHGVKGKIMGRGRVKPAVLFYFRSGVGFSCIS